MTRPRPRIRRRYRRRTVRVEVEYSSLEASGRATATTLGAGGMFIATEEPLDKGAKLDVSFCLPGSADQRYEIAAKVVWCNRPEDANGQALGMGIAFEDQRTCASLAVALERDPPSEPRAPDED